MPHAALNFAEFRRCQFGIPVAIQYVLAPVIADQQTGNQILVLSKTAINGYKSSAGSKRGFGQSKQMVGGIRVEVVEQARRNYDVELGKILEILEIEKFANEIALRTIAFGGRRNVALTDVKSPILYIWKVRTQFSRTTANVEDSIPWSCANILRKARSPPLAARE